VIHMKWLTRSEELILLTVWRLQSEAYGTSIRKQLEDLTGRSWSIGAVYVPLEKLAKYGYLATRQSPPTDTRGGRRKRYFQLTKRGVAALNEVRQVHETMWSNLPALTRATA